MKTKKLAKVNSRGPNAQLDSSELTFTFLRFSRNVVVVTE